MNLRTLETKVICSNPDNPFHNYFAWPSVARLQDGRLMMVASGLRMKHICPFGKVVGCISEDEGKTWTKPAVIIDTPLDDRDAGILPFGENSVMVTSFNNTVQAQRNWNANNQIAYIYAYLDRLEKIGVQKIEDRYLGSTFVVSHDGGRTFGEVKRMPITSPHGPTLLKDGTILYVGRIFTSNTRKVEHDTLSAYTMTADGEYEKLCDIENIAPELLSCEPHAIVLPDGKIIVHIRVQPARGSDVFTTYQCESYDNGRSFTRPHQILSIKGGAPAHLLRLENGVLISVYGYREMPYGIRMMYSLDDGETWSTDHVLYAQEVSSDLGYPCSVQLKDGSILTVFYAHPTEKDPAVIMQIQWTLEV